MELKLFYRTQRDLAVAINQMIDGYWEEKISEHELISGVRNLYENNKDKLIRNNDYTTVVQQHCGKRRLAVVGRILDIK